MALDDTAILPSPVAPPHTLEGTALPVPGIQESPRRGILSRLRSLLEEFWREYGAATLATAAYVLTLLFLIWAALPTRGS